ncbi:uncharacterized protein DUF4234 [Natranaerovirga pectinivora]|uniref:Uncharacterized protein DUF4234 n=1 Tax=Natranaerovirga pectinivora TaxID=682400 RepID=A0A4R3MQJ7_9FIRM|nr:DUF4234 domain-containing protein [Natranaerovirga pectinivora]TCT14700.1 uncharacterized protein DUF4234 [Natranaerovirga pectinivora]
MQKRSIGVSILLTFLTCGIYNIFWIYGMADDLIRYNGESESSAGLEILLGFLTCGLYFYYWYYKMGKRVYNAQVKANMYANDDSVLLLILSIFRLSIISDAIIQHKINEICDNHNHYRVEY